MKRNISDLSSKITKLNAYVGYVLPILTYASQAGMPNKTNKQELERIQKFATNWILGSTEPYKTRLTNLILLPLCMYIELHYLLYLLALQKRYYDAAISPESDNSNAEQTRQVLRGEFKSDENRLTKIEDNNIHRTKAVQSNDQKIQKNFFNRFFTPNNI